MSGSTSQMTVSEVVLAAAEELCSRLRALDFSKPVACIYNPMEYARAPYRDYVSKYAAARKKVVFLGMNPGPFGMAQTGVPFGEVSSVKNWLGICEPVIQPEKTHPKRPVAGFACPRSEISGQRLWGLFAQRFGKPETFFREHFVLNYCPLAFMEATGKNRTPDKLPPIERDQLFEACDEHLRKVVAALAPEWLIGVGRFASQQAGRVFKDGGPRIGEILHPSPASPASNRDWAGTVTAQLQKLGIW